MNTETAEQVDVEVTSKTEMEVDLEEDVPEVLKISSNQHCESGNGEVDSNIEVSEAITQKMSEAKTPEPKSEPISLTPE